MTETHATIAFLRQADARCTLRGHRLTPQRRHILALLLSRGGRATAYQLLEDMRAVRTNATPVTIYRALNFLMEQGLVRRVATTSTFLACSHVDGQHAVFMVCKRCGSVSVVHDEALRRKLERAARSAHFVVSGQETEIKALCESCSGAR
ncbi:Fur family transcriptional regulator [Paraburkholderia sp. FT54]|uniref:Fur family transcriptional regulator n=1 Tax=Paraburkholderia sp. FT54 TaxID=3074437 RepID=UPI0028774883|nr:Fur family transcriptional regulator [Paraburkholderia sp. FT54]WNC94045.1 Fur family transcriptional regulator [Paraburkholderia sp. FT54]